MFFHLNVNGVHGVLISSSEMHLGGLDDSEQELARGSIHRWPHSQVARLSNLSVLFFQEIDNGPSAMLGL